MQAINFWTSDESYPVDFSTCIFFTKATLLAQTTVTEGRIPDDWKCGVLLPVFKAKGDPTKFGSYRTNKLLEHAIKVVGR